MSVTESKKFSSHPLNVAEDKISQTFNRIHSQTNYSSNKFSQKTFHLSNSASLIEENLFQSYEPSVSQSSEGSIESSVDQTLSKSLTTETTTTLPSDNDITSISHESKWFREHLGRPLILGLREIVAKQPRDPFEYLAHSLLNYRSFQVMSKHRRQELTLRRSQLQRSESEKILANQAKDGREYLVKNDENGELDENFENYNMT